MSADFIPVIVGTDINTYLTGVCFHEEYGVRPYLLGREGMGVTRYSSLFERTRFDADIEDADGLVAALRSYAEEIPHEGRPLVLVGTSDKYVRLIVENRERLEDLYRMNVPPAEVNAALQDKRRFYALAAEHGLPIPETHFHQVGEPITMQISRYPVIIKPSNGIEYFRHEFPGREKVYRVDDEQQLHEVVSRIEAGGYRDQLIVQDFIPGDDTCIWDSVLYLNSAGRGEFVTFGQVALQEHTATAVGNYTAVVSRYDRPMMEQLVRFLETIGYTGFANADLKWDHRDGQYKVLEFNTRQGRSSYYATQLGHNLARHLVDDVVHGRRGELTYAEGEVLFTVVPRYILRRYVQNPRMAADVRRLIRSGRWSNPLWYRGDWHLKRRAFLLMRGYRYAKKYRESTWIRDGDAAVPAQAD
ncbi:carboxylate--amine ligase [Nesterenkonia marinintestina]|uniref:carboxylate--amine ligase n=1 Tax=Nesterenkonia marinintestina TaxID=2979865 RepID=UPI0021BE01A1|nr:ATP-grasp domain-containing protein [Nesterenkonia sp. GX14115]